MRMLLIDSIRATRAVAALSIVLAGCSAPPPVTVVPPESRVNVGLIQTAYLDSLTKLGRAPANREEFLPFITKYGDPDKVLRSPDDGLDYVIAWGFDQRTAPLGKGRTVVAYERKGKNGRRWVVQIPDVMQVTDEEFNKLVFPPGYEPGR